MKPRAFVLMPFAPDFDEIYNLFIAEALTERGFDVRRADDLRNQRNILHDVVSGIASADVVVADLTGSNPNVYYEVGIAHALRKRVVLVTQSVDDLPFDLRSYRVIPYNTHFAAINSARSELVAVALGALDGSVEFSSPVADYAQGGFHESAVLGADSTDIADEPGFLDVLVDTNDGFEDLGRIIAGVTEKTAFVTEKTTELTEQINAHAASPKPDSARRLRDAMRKYGWILTDYAKTLESATAGYSARLVETEAGLQSFVGFQNPVTEKELEQLREFLATLSALEEVTEGSRAGYVGLAETMSGQRNMERVSDRARRAVIAQLRRFAQSIDETVAMISRARGVGDRILRQAGRPNRDIDTLHTAATTPTAVPA